MDTLNESVTVLGSIRDEDQHIPLSLSIVVGAFAIRDSPKMWLMDYCPISDKELHGSAEEVMMRSRNLLLERLIGLFQRVEEFARDLWLPESRDLCSKQFSLKGICDRQDCPRRHSMPSSDECKLRIKVRVCKGICAVSRIRLANIYKRVWKLCAR